MAANGAAQPAPDGHGAVGLLLTNVGSPAAPTAAAVRPYLAQFLSDPRIIEWPRWLWLPILHGIVLNVRARRSARLYQRIWTAAGSPMLVLLREQAQAIGAQLEQRFTERVQIAVGLRYGNPSIASGLRSLWEAGARRILVFPLFPQYSATTTATTFDAVFDELKTWRWMPELRTITQYHDHPAYIAALTNSIREHWDEHGSADRLLFSFHGIPQSYALAGDPYEQQCRRTAQLAAGQLGFGEAAWEVAFQSRFGPEEWLQPYTDGLLAEWGQAGVRRVDAVCPGFSADCLETLDEIGREARETFLEAGGRQFHYIPALNKRPAHIAALTEIVSTHLQSWLDTADRVSPVSSSL